MGELKYEQEELWAAIQRLHQRLTKLEVVHETKRGLPEFVERGDENERREDLEHIMTRLSERP
jgi:muramoyltetrapeptide carboxypeptidase LdcA involved in peptidoglycan recycling